MAMRIVTISRELGSEGTAIAAQVADILGYQFIAKSNLEKILQQYGMVELDVLYKSTPGFWARLDDANLQLISMLNKTILGIAHRGNVVILGRGGFAALQGCADAIHVRIQAPFALRVKRIQEREQLPDFDAAANHVAKNDKARQAFLKAFYDIDVFSAKQFNLILDTSIVPVDMAAAWITEAAQSIQSPSVIEGYQIEDIEVDDILDRTIAEVLTPIAS
jgi:cytidylate kinase